MAILDTYVEFCDATTITATATSAIMGNVVDTGASPTLKDLGTSDIWFVLKIETAVTSNSAVTCQFYLYSDSVATLDSSATTHWSSTAIAKATLVRGYRVACVKLPSGDYERYLGIFCTTSGGTLLTGTANAYLTTCTPIWAAMPDGL